MNATELELKSLLWDLATAVMDYQRTLDWYHSFTFEPLDPEGFVAAGKQLIAKREEMLALAKKGLAQAAG